MGFSQHDETFFMESEDSQQPRMYSREAAKIMARNKQTIIANELSRLASEEYLEDIMQHLKQMEACS
jgi:hypothetical protein